MTAAKHRSTCAAVFYKKNLKILQNPLGNICVRTCFNKVAGLQPTILPKASLWHRCFPVNFAKVLRTPFPRNTCRWLVLKSRSETLKISKIIGRKCAIRKLKILKNLEFHTDLHGLLNVLLLFESHLQSVTF